MSKKNNSLLIAFGAALGAAAVAGLSYYLRYKSFNEEVDQDFHDYEEDEVIEEEPAKEETEETVSCADAGRTYITLDSAKGKIEIDTEIPDDAFVDEEIKEAKAAIVEDDTEGAN